MKNLIKQNGTFSGWNLNNATTCQLVGKNDKGDLVSIQNSNVNGLGGIRNNESLSRNVILPDGTVTNRGVIKFSVAVDDPNLQDYFTKQEVSQQTNQSSTTTTTTTNTSSGGMPTEQTQTRTTILPNGTIITETITTTQTQNTTTTTTTNETVSNSSTTTTTTDNTKTIKAPKQWMFVELFDASNGQSIERKILAFSNVSAVRTTCGFIYTYQLTFDLKKQYSQFSIRFSVVSNLNITWNLLNFDFSLGCRAFLASSGNSSSYNCDSCLSGFYPSYSINNQVQQCLSCDFKCKTCLSSNVCLTCIQNTILNEKTQMCEFSQFFKTLGKYQVVKGQVLETGNILGTQLLKSQGGIVEITQPLSNYQPFTLTYQLFYPKAFKDAALQMDVFINQQNFKMNSKDLPLDLMTKIPGISNTTQDIYRAGFSYNVSGANVATANAQTNLPNVPLVQAAIRKATIKMQTASNGNQFAVGNVNVIQFQCSKNCQECEYSAFTQTSECKRCAYFFDLSTNCLTCANGYYPTAIGGVEQCIKCHSTCKQCAGPKISDCVDCFDTFQLSEIIYDYQCINCIFKSQSFNSSTISQCINSPECLRKHPLDKVIINRNCRQCLQSSQNQLTSSDVCRSCWLTENLARSSCEPIPERGYQLYGSDISQGVVSSQWTSDKPLLLKNLTDEYKNLYGVDWQASGNQTTTITFSEPFLPSHRGLNIFFTVFKVNTWSNTSNDKINIVLKSEDKYIVLNNTINVNPAHGYEIYGGEGSGPEMMYTFVSNNPEHIYNGKLQMILTSTHTGVFLRDMEVYLGNCNQCDGNKLTYEVYYIPAYSTNDTKTGLDVWLTFNQGVNFYSASEETQNQIVNSFQFSIDQLGYQNLIPFVVRENRLNTWNFVKYFLPVEGNLINATLRVNNSMGNNIYSKVSKTQAFLSNPLVSSERKNLNIQSNTFTGESSHSPRLLLNERLSSTNVQAQVYRYEDLVEDQRKSMSQLESFYQFFQWFTLFTMIVFAFFGIGIIFEEFSILVQLLFLHIYISTELLPATFKQPLSRMQKMQNLNFFSYPNARSIQQGWFSNVLQPSSYPFTQYNIDVYFARSFYAIIIINLIYLFWFVVLFLLYKFVRPFRNSPNKIIKFFRDIPQRPLNYFDQIWRYQFITTMWAAFLQFTDFEGTTGEMRLNLALCIIAFVIALIWPVFVMIYTYRQHLVISVEHFLYLYNDIYYRKISSLGEKTTYYMYIAVRFGRYFFFALFIAVFIYRSIIGPVILLAITFLEIIYILKFSIFRDKLYLLLKIIESVGFIILEILLLIVYGFAGDTITKQGFISIGYGLGSLYILMIINGIIRVFYLCYKKISQIWNGRYDYGEKGDLENYDKKNPVTNIQLPTSERGLY